MVSKGIDHWTCFLCHFLGGTFHFHSCQASFFLNNRPKPWGNSWLLTRTMVEKNGESTPKHLRFRMFANFLLLALKGIDFTTGHVFSDLFQGATKQIEGLWCEVVFLPFLYWHRLVLCKASGASDLGLLRFEREQKVHQPFEGVQPIQFVKQARSKDTGSLSLSLFLFLFFFFLFLFLFLFLFFFLFLFLFSLSLSFSLSLYLSLSFFCSGFSCSCFPFFFSLPLCLSLCRSLALFTAILARHSPRVHVLASPMVAPLVLSMMWPCLA